MSNARTWAETFAPIEQANREFVAQNTWGHLAPVKHKTYRGALLFSVSAYQSGTMNVIDMNATGLDDSPWLYESINEYINSLEVESPGVYRIDFTLRNYKWTGKPVLVYSLTAHPGA